MSRFLVMQKWTLVFSFFVFYHLKPVNAEDRPSLPGLRVAILHEQAEIDGKAKANLDWFTEALNQKLLHIDEPIHSPDPKVFLADHPEITVAIGGNFEVIDNQLIASIFWRPDSSNPEIVKKHSLPSPLNKNSDRQIATSVAKATWLLINDDLYFPLRDYLATRQLAPVEDTLLKANTLSDQRKYQQAIKLVESLDETELNDAQNYRVNYLLGFCHRKLGKYEVAKRHFEKAIAFVKDDSAFLELGNLELNRGEEEIAADYYLQAISLKSGNETKARHNLALVYMSQGRLSEAKQQIKDVPDDPAYQEFIGPLRIAINKNIRDKLKRDQLFHKIWIALLVLAAIVIAGIIFMIYRRSQRDPELSAAQRLDFAGKLMGGLFSMLSLLAGTMIGIFIAQ